MNTLRNQMIKAVDMAFVEAKKLDGVVVDVTIKERSGSYDPVTEEYSAADSQKIVEGIRYNATAKQIADGTAENNDFYVTVKGKDFDSKPTVNDLIFIDGDRYAIVFIDDSSAGITYELQARR